MRGNPRLFEDRPSGPVVVVLSCWLTRIMSREACKRTRAHSPSDQLRWDMAGPRLPAESLEYTDRLCVKHSRLWSERFGADPEFMKRLGPGVTPVRLRMMSLTWSMPKP